MQFCPKCNYEGYTTNKEAKCPNCDTDLVTAPVTRAHDSEHPSWNDPYLAHHFANIHKTQESKVSEIPIKSYNITVECTAKQVVLAANGDIHIIGVEGIQELSTNECTDDDE